MSNLGKYKDTCTKLISAGKITAIPDESAKISIEGNKEVKHPTPEKIKRWRKDFCSGPGEMRVHPGLAYDKFHHPVGGFGNATTKSDHVNTTIKSNTEQGLKEYQIDQQETKYASRIREPLGKSYNRGHVLPDVIKSNQFDGFGVGTKNSEPAKNLIFARGSEIPENEENSKRYIKTHGSYGPGIQKNRDQDWGNLNPTEHFFGKTEINKDIDGTNKALKNEYYATSYPKTLIISKHSEDYKNVTRSELGKSQNLGQGELPYDKSKAFGRSTLRGNEWDAGNCITGDATEKENMPDKDLGVPRRVGQRNIVRCTEDENRIFGVPSIRNDIPKKRMKSVADPQNYGDESVGSELLQPTRFVDQGIDEGQFTKIRTHENIKQLFEKTGKYIEELEWQTIFNWTQENYNYDNSESSVRAVLNYIKVRDKN